MGARSSIQADPQLYSSCSTVSAPRLGVTRAGLAHRLKNTLALVQAIAVQTLRDAAVTKKMESFSKRMGALGHAHDILLRQD